MNYSIIRLIIAKVLIVIGVFMLAPCLVSFYYREGLAWAYAVPAAVCIFVGLVCGKAAKSKVFYAKEGFVTVALCWVIMSLAGAVPYVLTGEIPFYIDALFETVSGFTTTGSSILTNVEALSKTSLFWRSFTNWIGGMGILVFLMAIMPLAGSYNMHLMRAESPGPSVGKLVPKVKRTAVYLYAMYIFLTALEFLILKILGVTFYEAITVAFSTAATGGFAVYNASIGAFSYGVQNVVTVFMLLFGVNFNIYFILLMRRPKEAFKNEEVRYYFIIYAAVVALITANVYSCFDSVRDALHHVAFTVSSMISSTGFATADYVEWPMFSQVLILFLMFSGACAGSTGGGMKVSRVLIILKLAKNEMSYLSHPRRVRQVRLNGQVVSKETTRSVQAFFQIYICIVVLSVILVSINELDFTTTFSSVVTTLNNMGPGLGVIGPTGNFSVFSPLSKIVLIFDMLAGRLEVFPMMMILWPATWRKWK